MKKTINQIVKDNASTLLTFSTTKDLRDWAISNGMDSRAAFPRFKAALLELGINYETMRFEQKAAKAEVLKAQITHKITLYSDAKASAGRFGITDQDGNVIWHGRFFSEDNAGEQSRAELCAAKKAVWLASKVKEAIGASAIALTLYVDAEWLTYQDHAGQKGYQLTQLADMHNIQLHVKWISGKKNPADYWTTATGYQKWNLTDLTTLATSYIVEQAENDANIK